MKLSCDLIEVIFINFDYFGKFVRNNNYRNTATNRI